MLNIFGAVTGREGVNISRYIKAYKNINHWSEIFFLLNLNIWFYTFLHRKVVDASYGESGQPYVKCLQL